MYINIIDIIIVINFSISTKYDPQNHVCYKKRHSGILLCSSYYKQACINCIFFGGFNVSHYAIQ